VATVDPRILGAIPHRPPFLLVTSIESLEAKRIVCHHAFLPTEPFYAGHYPGQPITPGVLVCEAIFQTGAILAALTLPPEQLKGWPVLSRIRDARFRRVVPPGALISLEVELVDVALPALDFKGSAKVGGQEAVRIAFACMLASGEALGGGA